MRLSPGAPSEDHLLLWPVAPENWKGLRGRHAELASKRLSACPAAGHEVVLVVATEYPRGRRPRRRLPLPFHALPQVTSCLTPSFPLRASPRLRLPGAAAVTRERGHTTVPPHLGFVLVT